MRRLVILLIVPLLFLWLISFREVRLKIADYYLNQGKFNQALNWYEKVVRKGKLRIDKVSYEEDLSELKSTRVRAKDEKLLTIKRFRGYEQGTDVNVKTGLTNLLMGLDFSMIVTEGNGNYAVAWTGQNIKIEGAIHLVDGIQKGSKALMVEGVGYVTRIFAPSSALNLREGSLLVWARLAAPRKAFSTLVSVNKHSQIYIYHRGQDGKVFVGYNLSPVGTSLTSLSVTDDNWHHYVFTWRDGEQKFYIDNREALSGTIPASTVETTMFCIGWVGDNNIEQWHGPIDEFLTVDRVLTANEVRSLYELRKSFVRWARGSDEDGLKH